MDNDMIGEVCPRQTCRAAALDRHDALANNDILLVDERYVYKYFFHSSSILIIIHVARCQATLWLYVRLATHFGMVGC